MQSIACAITMVRDDSFFLKIWLDYYGRELGPENCYVINHGREAEVAELAAEANVIGIPGDTHRNFDGRRWRMLNGFVSGLRSYYKHVIVGDVDELVVMDPERNLSLLEFLDLRRPKRVFTPLGLEVIHRVDIEQQPINDRVLGPRRHIRLAPHYSKPCILSVNATISRGGHYTDYDQMLSPDPLYLFHLKYCDMTNYQEVLNRRNALVDDIGEQDPNAVGVGGHWFKSNRSEDRAVFEAFADYDMQEGFDMAPYREEMSRGFRPRPNTEFYEFPIKNRQTQFRVPDRFVGAF